MAVMRGSRIYDHTEKVGEAAQIERTVGLGMPASQGGITWIRGKRSVGRVSAEASLVRAGEEIWQPRS